MAVTLVNCQTIAHGAYSSNISGLTLPSGGMPGDIEIMAWNNIEPGSVSGDLSNNDWSTVPGSSSMLVRTRTSSSSDTYNIFAGAAETTGMTAAFLRVRGAAAYSISAAAQSTSGSSGAFPVISAVAAGVAAFLGFAGLYTGGGATGSWAISGTGVSTVINDSEAGGSSGWTETMVVASETISSAGTTGSVSLTNTAAGGSSLQYTPVTLFFSSDAPPNVAGWVTADGLVHDKTVSFTNIYTETDPDSGDVQSKRDRRLSSDGGATWTTTTDVTTSTSITHAANSLAPGTYQEQVLPYDSQGVPAASWSPSLHFTVGTAPAAPTFVSPDPDAVIGSSTQTWTISCPSLDSLTWSIVDADTGATIDPGATINDSTARTFTSSVLPNDVNAKAQVFITKGGLPSSTASQTNAVVYDPPPTPAVAYFGPGLPNDDGTVTTLRIIWHTADPTGEQPAATSVLVELSIDGGATTSVRIPAQAISDSVVYRLPAADTDYVVRLTSTAINKVTASTPWIS